MWFGAASGIALGVISGAMLFLPDESAAIGRVVRDAAPGALQAPDIVDLAPSPVGLSTTGFVEIANRSDEAVEIVHVWSSCACMTAIKPPFTVNPKSTFRLPVEMSASMQPGVAVSKIRLTTGDGAVVETEVRQRTVPPLPDRATLRPDGSARLDVNPLYTGLVANVTCYPADADQPIPHRLSEGEQGSLLIVSDVRDVLALDVVLTLGPPIERRVSQRIPVDADAPFTLEDANLGASTAS